MSVRRGDGSPLGGSDEWPYSKGMMARALVGVGLSVEPAYRLARRIEVDLAEHDERAVGLDRLEALAVEVLGEPEGVLVVERLRRWQDLQSLEEPILLLVGGATGTGKSTVATEAAYRLGITRFTSTDFIRQTMRSFFTPEAMPSVHLSSFETEPLVDGFVEQSRNVLVGVEGAIERALTEGWSMVLEGVHLVPGMVPRRIDGARVVHAVLAIETEDVHRTHFHVRDATTGGLRAMEKYLTQLESIRALQDYIVARAERTGVPVIESSNPDRAIASLLELVLAAAE